MAVSRLVSSEVVPEEGGLHQIIGKEESPGGGMPTETCLHPPVVERWECPKLRNRHAIMGQDRFSARPEG